jgi:hypothetical protein
MYWERLEYLNTHMSTLKVNEASTKGETARVILLAAMLVVAGGIATLGSTTAVYAQVSSEGKGTPPKDPGRPNDPNCWGEANSGLAQDSGGVGEHASDPVPSLPGRETPRKGVGNQAEDTPPEHGETVGPLFGQPCDPDDTGR